MEKKIKDYHSIERHLPVASLRGFLLFPKATTTVRLDRATADRLIAAAGPRGDLLAVHLVRDSDDNGQAVGLHRVGTLARIDSVRYQSGAVEITLEGLERILSETFSAGEPTWSDFEFTPDVVDLDEATLAVLLNNIRELSLSILDLVENAGKVKEALRAQTDVESLINFCMQNMPIGAEEKQAFLEIRSVKDRGLRLLELLSKQRESLRVQIEMAGKLSEAASKNHRENILREQLKAIKEELDEGRTGSGKDWQTRIKEAGMPPAVEAVALEELAKLESQAPNSPETGMLRNYLELMVALPWKDPVNPDIDLTAARASLDADHYGLDKVKDLIIQHLAVMKLKKDRRGINLLLVGPPGVGKTSLGKSIAKAMGREFLRASLGGVRDDAEIRGHRRTYLGALPGRIIAGMKKAKARNPVFMLDELDKLVNAWNGDPGAALLEVLDPEQNDTFADHYLEVPYDLSQVFFIGTANSLEGIPGPLLDRLEVIQLSGYTEREKVHIALDHLVPKQLEEHGLSPAQLHIPEAVISEIIQSYTREAGVRDLQRKIAALCRVFSERVVKAEPALLPLTVQLDDLDQAFGGKIFDHEVSAAENPPGVATGLAWTPMGGDILFIEATSMPGSGKLTLTGQLGEVMKESAQIALSLVRAQLPFLTTHFDFKETDIHVHVPSGAIPKDGPSAGTALLVTLASLVLGRPVDPKLALTGEITLRGAVMPVGGIKEKLTAAHRAGIRRIIMSAKNAKDLRDLPEEVRSGLDITLVEKVSEVFQAALGIGGLGSSAVDNAAAPVQSPTPSSM